MKSKLIAILLLGLLLFPTVYGADDDPGWLEGLATSIAEFIPEQLHDFFINLISAPIIPFVAFIKVLLTAEIKISAFKPVWRAICYVISFFYLFLFIWAGFTFLTSSGDFIKRSNAKENLKNAVLMIFFVNASYLIYQLVLGLSSILNKIVLSLTDHNFFLLSIDLTINTGMQFIILPIYMVMLFICILMLILRYIVVSLGIIILPIAIFCYFVPPLKSYGRFMLNALAIFIFITFIDLLIILACSLIVENPIFANFKMAVMIVCFGLINYSIYKAFKFAMSRANTNDLKSDLQKTAKYIAMAVA